MFFWIAASVADTATVNAKANKTILAKGVSKNFVNGKGTFIKGQSKLRNPPF